MKDLVLAFRTLSGKGQNNFIKILSLGIGLAVGLVLISKIYLDLSFENFYPDAERIYQIQEDVNHQDEGEDVFSSYGQVSGGVASGMKTEIPQVEAATRFTGIGDDMTFYTVEDKKAYKTDFAILGDSSLFDVLPRPVLAGNPKEVLSRPMQVMISHSIAKNRGNIQDIIGKKIYLDNFPGKELTIGGIFEDIPANSEQRYDMVISMPSISEFMWDGSMNWLGNDRYLGYVKLQPNTHPENLATAIRQMQAKYQPLDELEKLGVDLHYSLLPLTKMHSDRPEIKRMTILLSLLAFAILFTAILNYILVVISSLVNRTKGVAIRKCYGADTNNISSSMFAETGVHLLISLLIAVALIILFRDTVEDLLAVPLSALFNLRSGILLVIACVVVFFITAIVPAQIFSKIPVSLAFRNYQETRRIWKLALLFLQFTATAFLVTFLIIIVRQHNRMIHDNPGYTYENVLYSNTAGVKNEAKQIAIDELKRMPEIEAVATCDVLPIHAGSGNNVLLEGNDQELFNIVDLYRVDAGYLSLMEIPIVEGKGFDKNHSESLQVIVSQLFADKIAKVAGWKDGVVGKTVQITEHGNCTIIGIYPNIRINSIMNAETRPSAMFYAESPAQFILIKPYRMTPEIIQKVSTVLQQAMPQKDITVNFYKMDLVSQYDSSRLFRNSVMTGGIITLIIALIGLIGYINDEVNRRRAEISIRKVNGATIYNVQQLFLVDILKIAIPALLLGSIASAISANKWMENFSEKAGLSPLLFITCAITVLAVILTVVLIDTYKVAIQNPSKTIIKL